MKNQPNRTDPAIRPEHLRRSAVIYLRQSTPEQVHKHSGSAHFQRSLADVARSYGWLDSQIQIIDDDLGKSGSSTEGRSGWQSLQAMIEANQVGVVFAANISRFSRQVHDFELFRLRAVLHNVLLHVDGRFINPANAGDAVLAQLTAMLAQFDNHKRAEIMMRAKVAKVRKGLAVSQLPVGWIKRPDGVYDYDPETKDTIQLVIKTFWETRSVYKTVKALAKAGVQMPNKKKRRIRQTKPTISRVLTILTHPAYSGTYIYGKTRVQVGSRLPGRVRAKLINLPEGQWIKIHDHHPAYLTREEQEEIKTILKRNRFVSPYRQYRVRPITQGLLRCAVCGSRLRVYYPSKHYHFRCDRAVRYAEKPCLSFSGEVLEQCILREVVNVLKAPPIEMLKSALKASEAQTHTRLSCITAERERLRHQIEAAQERVERTYGGLPRIHFDALEKLEKLLQEIRQFEQKISLQPRSSSNEYSEEELDELCGVVCNVPALWQDDSVTHEERKEILQCLIDSITVAATNERLDATIFWKTGAKTSLYVWRTWSHHHLIRKLHSQRLTASEIKEHLAAGKTSTGQVVHLAIQTLYLRMDKLGLKQQRFSLTAFWRAKSGRSLSRGSLC